MIRLLNSRKTSALIGFLLGALVLQPLIRADDIDFQFAGGGGGGTPGGADTQVQFNNAGAFGGDPDFTFTGGNTVTGTIINGSTRVGFGLLDAAGAITIGSGGIISEGTTADGFELTQSYGDHTADMSVVVTASADTVTSLVAAGRYVDLHQASAAGSDMIRRAQATSATGYADFEVYNDQGVNSRLQMISYGSSQGGLLFNAVSANNRQQIVSNGSASAGLLIGTATSDAMYFGTNDIIRAEVAPASNLWTFGGVAGAANSIAISDNAITSEGSSADANELVLAFGNHSADVTMTLTAEAAGALRFSEAATAGALIFQSTSANDYAFFGVQNDQGANSQGAFVQWGSTFVGTSFGVNRANTTQIQSQGSSSAGMLLGTLTADPLYIGTNDVARLLVGSGGILSTQGTITAGGTTGAQTINKMSGTVNFAAAATTLVVTNSLASTSSTIYAMARTNDGTCSVKDVEPGAGSFTIRMTAGCTAETSVGWWIVDHNL